MFLICLVPSCENKVPENNCSLEKGATSAPLPGLLKTSGRCRYPPVLTAMLCEGLDQTIFKFSLSQERDSPGKFVEGSICCTVRSMMRLPRSREDRKAASFSLMISMICSRIRRRVSHNTLGSFPAHLSPATVSSKQIKQVSNTVSA